MDHLRHRNYKKEHTEIKYLNNTQRNRVLNVKNRPLELAKDFNPIQVSIDGLDKFKGKEITKKSTFAKNTW